MVSIKDIAKIAGVNVSSVSRALNGSSEVGEETRKRIEAIAKVLGYTPNYSARALVGKSTMMIGVIVPEISSNYYAQDVSIIGYDNIRESEYLSIPLTTVSPPIVEMASKGIELLLKRIELGEDAQAANTVLYPELIVRKSASLLRRDL